jgi:alpha-amylase
MRHALLAAAGSLFFTLSAALLPAQTNLALGRPITASSSVGPFVAANANDGSLGTYWEGAGPYPDTLSVSLGANTRIAAIVVALDAGWGGRTQTIEVLGRALGAAGFTSLVPATAYTFDPAIENRVTIPVAAEVSDIRLSFTTNSGSTGGQAAEVQLLGPSDATSDTNLALGRPIVASSTIFSFVAWNANDGVVTSYWEGGADTYPNTLSVDLGGNARLSAVVVRLNPGWGGRTQTIEVLGRPSWRSQFASLVAPAVYTLEPGTGNSVTIPIAATAAEVRLAFTANSGATAGQVAELQVLGTRRGHDTPPLPTGTSDTMVHLFEWRWTDVARECETYLGPKGYQAVQISPPHEHITDARWWARYQPVSYLLESRGGTREQFVDMVRRCRDSGVDIYADVVLNHTASLGGGGIGWAGTPWSLRSHPMFGVSDYHNASCPNGIDYQDADSVQTCDLVGLPDLDTGAAGVQRTLAGYVNDLLDIGVAGFRIDAAKHVSPVDLFGILRRTHRRSTIYPEVIDLGGPEAVHSRDYIGFGPVEEFKYSRYIGAHFKGAGQLHALQSFGASWGMLPGARAVVFTDNHDNQRGHGAGGTPLTYRDGRLYDLGNVFLLAWPYGYPRVMSSYDFVDGDAGPPAVPVHDGGSVNCFGSAWKCEHRFRPVANMVGFRRTAGSAPVARWWDNGRNQIAFARLRRGFVVINREGASLTRTFSTTLPAGTYCNVIEGDFSAGSCTGPTIRVNAAGQATITVPALGAVALHIDARL